MVYSHDCGSKMSPTNSIVAASLHTNLVGELVHHKLIYRNVLRKFEGSFRSSMPGMWYITIIHWYITIIPSTLGCSIPNTWMEF